jgi:predicted  nucleic acid-binding Zn-ribbon protein
MINKYPYEIETPLDRRAMTIDILAGELERKNKNTAAWRKKVEELHTRINELENDCLMLEEKISGLETKQNFYPSSRLKRTMRKKRSSNIGKANGKAYD